MSELGRHNLHHYQDRGVSFIKQKHGCALFLDMGLGKTVTSLTAITELVDDFDTERVLVIAPLRVANTVWHVEASKWGHTKGLDFAICTGEVKNRLKALSLNATVTVINRENIPWLVEHYKTKWPFDMVIVDESSSFKNPSSKRFRALKKVQKYINRMVLLTGTPASNGYLDLWSQFYLIDRGGRLGFTFGAYKRSYFIADDYMGYTFRLKEGAMKEIQDRIQDLVLSMSAADYLELPDVISVVLENKLGGKLLKEYKKFEEDAILKVGDEELSAVSAAVLTNKLLQFSSGAVYGDEDEDGKRPVFHFHDLKLDTMDEIIEENPNDNILVAYNYKHELDRLVEKYPEAVVLDKEGKAVADWNAGKIKMLLAHPASAGHGLNLQYGGSLIVWFGFTWSLELYQQFNARLNRQGQTNVVRIMHIAVGAVENKLMRALARKDITQAELLEALK